MSEDTPAFRAEGDQVFKNPVTKHNDDGSRSITMGFPVCTVSEWVKGADGLSPAETVAGLLNQSQAATQMLDALKAADKALEATLSPGDSMWSVINAASKKIDAAIAAAEEGSSS